MEEFALKFINQFLHIYFWVYLIFWIIMILYNSSDEGKRIKEIKIQKGTYDDQINIFQLIGFIIFIMSFKY